MKNLKKLFVAAIMLVVALTAVVSSTYAWFTKQNQADVKEIEMQVGTAGNDLQVATAIDGSYNYSLTLGDINGLLVPVSYDNGLAAFYKLEYNGATQDYEYTATGASDVFAPGDTFTVGEEDKGYLQYDLFFKSATAANEVKIDAANSTFISTNAYAAAAMRIMFVTYQADNATVDTVLIWEPTYTSTSTFGNGTYFLYDEPYIAYGSMDTFLDMPVDPEAEDAAYTLDATWFATRQYTPSLQGTASNLLIKTLGDSNTPARVTVRIWMEGWDGDAFNLASTGVPVKAYLKFLGKE